MINPTEIIKARGAGEIRYSVLTDYSGDLNSVLAKFGLVSNQSLLVEHDRSSAVAILTVLLEKDMAYDGQLMSTDRAVALAEEIVKSHETQASKFYSNGNWAKKESWNPFTDSTFDAGLIITTDDHRYFCIWFQDED
jgi:hypothetical protein